MPLNHPASLMQEVKFIAQLFVPVTTPAWHLVTPMTNAEYSFETSELKGCTYLS